MHSSIGRGRCSRRIIIINSASRIGAMRLVKEISITSPQWTCGGSVSPGWLAIGLWWDTAPLAFGLALPFLRVWLEGNSDHGSNNSSPWGWSLARLIIWKTEFRLDIDLNLWSVGLACTKFDDFSVHLGPMNIQIETNKFFADDCWPGVPTVRFFLPPNHSVEPWPPRCRCSPPDDQSQRDDATDFADGRLTGRIPMTKDSHGQK
jgi:hypothetical protein